MSGLDSLSKEIDKRTVIFFQNDSFSIRSLWLVSMMMEGRVHQTAIRLISGGECIFYCFAILLSIIRAFDATIVCPVSNLEPC